MSKEKVRKPSKFKYQFDNFMAAGPKSIFIALLLLFVAAFVLTGALRAAVDLLVLKTPVADALKNLWLNFLQITDAGAIAENTDSPAIMKSVGIATMLIGMIFFSAVIAFITTQLDIKIGDLKKGRSAVVEKDFVLILGWGDIVVEIIRELIVANESQKDAVVVVLSETDKEEMDDYLNVHLPDRKTTRIVTRSGKPSSLVSLKQAGLLDCKSVIVLPYCSESATEEEKTVSDAKVMKTILAVVAASKDDDEKADIIAEVYDPVKRRVIRDLAPEEITMVETGRMIAKIIVQTSRTSGLGFVYDQLVGFQGSEIYIAPGEWNGAAFGELVTRYPDGIPFGVRKQGGKILLNPPIETKMEKGDEVIIIAGDDSTIKLAKKPLFAVRDLPLRGGKREKAIEKELVIGWNSKAPVIIGEYSNYLLPGSVVNVLLSQTDFDGIEMVRELQKNNSTLSINILDLDPMEMEDLRKAKPWEYDNVILLNRVEEDSEKIDSAAITTLLLMKALFKEIEDGGAPKVKTQLITEVMNSENLELVTRTGVNDSIISFQMVSKVLAQIAENPEVLAVYEDLFSEEGSEIYLKPVDLYLAEQPGKVRFLDLALLAQKRGEVLLGYRRIAQENDVSSQFGIVLNPPKNLVFEPREGDCLVVLAESEL